MIEGIQPVIDFGKSCGAQVHPILGYISQKVAGFIDVSATNVHLILIGAISMYLAHMLSGRELKIKFWIISGLLFWLFTYLGF